MIVFSYYACSTFDRRVTTDYSGLIALARVWLVRWVMTSESCSRHCAVREGEPRLGHTAARGGGRVRGPRGRAHLRRAAAHHSAAHGDRLVQALPTLRLLPARAPARQVSARGRRRRPHPLTTRQPTTRLPTPAGFSCATATHTPTTDAFTYNRLSHGARSPIVALLSCSALLHISWSSARTSDCFT